MQKTVKILCLATAVFFVLTGVSFATQIFTFKNPDSTVGANISLDLTTQNGLYKYTYQVENVNFFGGHFIYEFDLPVSVPLSATGTLIGTGDNPAFIDNVKTVGGVNYLPVYFNTLYLPGILPGYKSDAFFILSEFSAKEGDAILSNDDSTVIGVVSNLGRKDGANDTNPVPEPATLLLLGVGALGLEGARRLRLMSRKV